MKVLIFLLLFIFILSVIAIIKLEKSEVKYVKSNIDGKEYLVRDVPDKQEASDLLAKLKQNMFKLRDHLLQNKSNEKYKEYSEYIDQLNKRITNVVINESTPDSTYTSYSVNKGEQIVFCLRSKYDSSLHDLNLLMYVAIHELAHVACPEYGHTDLFKKIFAFFSNISIKINIYEKIDFPGDPTEYCGMIISESII
jgi:predicted metal-dependent hydrolase